MKDVYAVILSGCFLTILFIVMSYAMLSINDCKAMNEQLKNSLSACRSEIDQSGQQAPSSQNLTSLTLNPPYTVVSAGEVKWVFRTLNNELVQWGLPIDNYKSIVELQKPYQTLDMDGSIIMDFRPFVTPDVFINVISSITQGRSAQEFAQEVFNLRKQLTSYREEFTETPKWSVETMTEANGDCEDFGILMASLLLAGNELMDYGMNVSMIYMDLNNPSNPVEPNHLMISIDYSDGSQDILDTTADVYNPYMSVKGWVYSIV